MHLIYIDDSRDEKLCVFSALAVPAAKWKENFRRIKEFRRELKRTDGIYVSKEFHAWELVSGRGKISDKIVTKYRRCQIFFQTLNLVSELDGARLFNAVFPQKMQDRAFERMVNRINRTLQEWNSYGILFCDEGREGAITRLVAFRALSGAPVDIHGAKELLADGIEGSDVITIGQLEGVVCDHFGISPADVRSSQRKRCISMPRGICMYLARTLTDCSCKEIGEYFGGKSHATVIFATKKVTCMKVELY